MEQEQIVRRAVTLCDVDALEHIVEVAANLRLRVVTVDASHACLYDSRHDHVTAKFFNRVGAVHTDHRFCHEFSSII